MDLLVICTIVCLGWMAVALVVAALCRAAARVDSHFERPASDVLRAHDIRASDSWRALPCPETRQPR